MNKVAIGIGLLAAVALIVGLSVGLTRGNGSTDNTTSATSTAPAPTSLTILHMNDHHSHLTEGNFDLGADYVPSFLGPSIDRLRVYYGGFPRLVSLIRSIEEDTDTSTGNVLKLHAGDAITGTAFHTLFKGEADADMMNRICFDAFSIGNHGKTKYLHAIII